MTEQTAPKDDAIHNPMTAVKHDGRSGSGQLFNSMTQAKRHPENEGAQARRESLKEQSAPKGVLGNAWDSLTKPNHK